MAVLSTTHHTEVKIRCARCGTETVRTPAMLEARPVFLCPSCGTSFDCTQVLKSMRGVRRKMGLLGGLLGKDAIKIDFKINRT